MVKPISTFSQEEYKRVFDAFSARSRGFSQTECEKILMDHGASHGQAKNGAYVYLHHTKNIKRISRKGTVSEYKKLLDDFNGTNKSNQECVRYLERKGFTYGQAKSAAYRYRVNKDIIGR